MKKSISILLLLVMLFSFAACSGGNTPADGDTTAADTTAPVAEDKWPAVEGTAFYVDASASEGGDGSKDAPFISIPEAQTKIREMKSGEGLPEGGITVLVAPGEYGIKNGLNFTAEDSGTETSPIKYVSAEKGGAVLDGGVTLGASDFESLSDEEKAIINDDAAKEAVRKVDLSKYGLIPEDLGELHQSGFSSPKPSSGLGYSELFINNERMTLSRYPNVNAEDTNLRTGSGNGISSFQILSIFEFEAPAMAIKERGTNWDIDDLWVFGYFCYDWSDATVKVSALDIESLNVTLAQDVTFGIQMMKKFYFFNILAETDVPGEYYIDRENAVLYIYPTEDFENSNIAISVLDEAIVTGSDVSYITFDGFELSGSRTNAFSLSGDHITVDNCLIRDVRYNAVNATGTNIIIQNNEICQIGDSGIIMTGGNASTLTNSGNLVYNNYIHHWGQVGRTYESAVELYGCGSTVSHNEMHDAPHQAITWDGPNHVMEYNEIYNVCTETGDCGAIYSGRRYDWYGGVIRYNYIHNIGSPNASAQGIYLDDAISGQTVYGNVIVSTADYGIQVGGGRDNVIENNLIINVPNYMIIFDSRAYEALMDGESHWFYQCVEYMSNLLIPAQTWQAWLDTFPGYGDIIPYTADYTGDLDDPRLSINPANNVVRTNMYYVIDEDVDSGDAISDRVVSMGTVENNHKIMDLDHTDIPGYASGDYTLADDAEAYQYGFEKLPFDEMGRLTE